MKKKVHPQWHPKAKLVCACGNVFEVGSTQPELQIEVCAACHPFYTGKMRYIDAMGRVEKFMVKRKAAVIRQDKVKKKRKKKKEKRPETLREMLQGKG